MMNNKTQSRNTKRSLPSISTLIIKVVAPLVFLSASGCASTSQYTPLDELDGANASTQKVSAQSGGGYYLDDGPGNNPPSDIHLIPDAVPKIEPLRKANMKPYTVMGKTFKPMTALEPYKVQGTASWYGKRYHGNATASGEIYDMYAMTAAHPTLPLPSYARITNVKNGKTVIVRINDRGPFLSERLIDLSYTAAHKLDIINNGSGEVTVEAILPEEIIQLASAKKQTQPATSNQEKRPTAYLQLGAFGTVNNARNYLSQIQKRLPSIGKSVGITKKDGLFKIKAGPYRNMMLAQQAANTISQQLSIRPIMIID